MRINTDETDPNIRPHTIAAYASLLFLSAVGIWSVDPVSEIGSSQTGEVLAQTTQTTANFSTVLTNQRPPVTQSSITAETVTEATSIAFETTYVNEPSWEVGTQEVTQAGEEGSVTRTYNVVTYFGEVLEKKLLREERIEPVREIITRGTKPKTIETPTGPFKYTQSFDVWSTSYDGNCVGCNGITYTGTPVHHGICAVDPAVIPLGTEFYVPGYGMCLAADIGGGINGNHVDLGFKDVRFGWWSARWTTIYIE